MRYLFTLAVFVVGFAGSAVVHVTDTEWHWYAHIQSGQQHCTGYFDHWPQVYEFHGCDQVCADQSIVASLD